jgi:hypothetical protein
MALHIAATLGLLGGAIGTAYKGYRAWKEGRDVLNVVQGCVTGYSWYGEGSWDPRRMVFTIPVLTGATVTYVSIKTGYNGWLPTGANL